MVRFGESLGGFLKQRDDLQSVSRDILFADACGDGPDHPSVVGHAPLSPRLPGERGEPIAGSCPPFRPQQVKPLCKTPRVLSEQHFLWDARREIRFDDMVHVRACLRYEVRPRLKGLCRLRGRKLKDVIATRRLRP